MFMKIFLSFFIALSFFSHVQALNLETLGLDALKATTQNISSRLSETTGTGQDSQDIFLQSYAKKVSYVDAKTLKNIGGGVVYFYAQDKNGIYFWALLKKVPADIASFEYLTGSFAKDATQAFFEEKPIIWSDAKTFSVASIKDPWKKNTLGESSNFSQDKKFLYHENKKVGIRFSYSDIVSKNCVLQKWKQILCFWILKEQGYAFTGNTVVYKEGYFSDTQHLMYASDYDVKTLSTEIKNITYIGSGYLSDTKNVYKNGKMLSGINPQNIQVISQFYLKNDEKVYFFEREVVGADPKTFEVFEWEEYGALSLLYAKDATHIYKNGAILVWVSPETFDMNKEMQEVSKAGIWEAFFWNTSWYSHLKLGLKMIFFIDIGVVLFILLIISNRMFQKNYIMNSWRVFFTFAITFGLFSWYNYMTGMKIAAELYFIFSFFFLVPIIKYVYGENLSWWKGFLNVLLLPMILHFLVYFIVWLAGGAFVIWKFF